MTLGCLAVLAAGIWLCREAPYFMLRLNIGAVLVALTQFFGMIHMFAGMAAMSVTAAIFHGSVAGTGGRLHGIADVAFCTVLTGLELILLASAIGYLAGFMYELPTGTKDRSVR